MSREMLAPSTQLEFDYGDLDKPAVRSLEARAKAITATQEKVRKTTAEGVLKIGEELKAAHDLLAGKGRDGVFGPWVKLRCGFTPRTAERAIQAHATFGQNKCDNVSHFFDASALYLLSADCCPEEATEEAIKLAEAITATQAPIGYLTSTFACPTGGRGVKSLERFNRRPRAQGIGRERSPGSKLFSWEG